MTSYAIRFPLAFHVGPGAASRGGSTVDGTVAAAVGGDEAAFERLYRDHVGRVYALALRLAGGSADADRLTQDVFVRAWERLASFRGESTFGTWLHRLAINLILTDRRSAGRLTLREGGDPGLIELAPAGQSEPGSRLDLDQAIAGLPPGARAVFVLHDVEGYQHQEISAMTGIAVGTSKAQLFRARRLLREALEQ